MQEDRPHFGPSELLSGQAERVFDPSECRSGQGGCLLVLAGLQGWAESEGSVSGSWGSASLSWGQTGNLHETERKTRFNLCGKCQNILTRGVGTS